MVSRSHRDSCDSLAKCWQVKNDDKVLFADCLKSHDDKEVAN